MKASPAIASTIYYRNRVHPCTTSTVRKHRRWYQLKLVCCSTGTTLSQIRTQCPEEQPVCVEETPQDDECPENFLVESVFNYKYDFINLQLSWDKTARDERVTIRIHQKVGPDSKKDCYEEALIVNHSLQVRRGWG